MSPALPNAELTGGNAAVPSHVAIIMDGNGRWATSRGLPRIEGHRRGAEAVRRTVRAAGELGINYLTLFGFSTENWKRPESEITGLMGLLRLYLRNEIKDLNANGVRLRFIGNREDLASDIVNLISEAETATSGNQGLTLTIALSYGARDEVTRAARDIAADIAAGRMTIDDINEDAISSRLYTADMPEPDLLIRTSGEQRISNFLLWQCAYTEFFFVDTLWPDFGADDLQCALESFQGRERRYGATGAQ